MPGLVLVPATADALDIPFIASGGFADGRGLAAALVLGAHGINMGTRFMCTQESPVSEAVKQRIVEQSERDTVLIFRPLRNTARVAANSVGREVVRILDEGGQFEDVRHLVAGIEGELEAGIWSVGMAQGLVHDVPPAGEVVRRVVTGAEVALRSALGSRVDDVEPFVA